MTTTEIKDGRLVLLGANDGNAMDSIHASEIAAMARELLAHRRASQAAPAPSDALREAAQWVDAAMVAIYGYERDLGVRMDDDCEIGRIDDSRDSPSFRIRVGHLRRISAALSTPTEERQ